MNMVTDSQKATCQFKKNPDIDDKYCHLPLTFDRWSIKWMGMECIDISAYSLLAIISEHRVKSDVKQACKYALASHKHFIWSILTDEIYVGYCLYWQNTVCLSSTICNASLFSLQCNQLFSYAMAVKEHYLSTSQKYVWLSSFDISFTSLQAAN